MLVGRPLLSDVEHCEQQDDAQCDEGEAPGSFDSQRFASVELDD